MTAPRILVRADGGGRLGAGHVTRCIALADECARRGAAVEFVVRAPPSIVRQIADHGHRVVELGPEPLDRPADAPWSDGDQTDDARETIRRSTGHDAVVVDHYGLGATWERTVGGGDPVLVLDDLANRPHHCTVLSDHNWYGPHTRHRYDDLVADTCTLLLGPRYAVLQDEYRIERARHRIHRWPPETVLVTFGGTDAARETEKVVQALSDSAFEGLHLTVVVGSAERADETLRRMVADRPGTELVVAAPSLAPLLREADIVVGASGAGTWERLCLDVPAIVATSSPHQSGVTRALAAAGLTRWVGLTSTTDPETYRAAMRGLETGPRPALPPVVDGFGAGRLAEMLVPAPTGQIGVRRAEIIDAPSMIGLRGETTGEGSDLLDGPDSWAVGAEEFLSAISTDDDRLLVVEMAGVPLGGCWVDDDGTYDVVLLPPLQARGIETRVRSLAHELLGKPDIEP